VTIIREHIGKQCRQNANLLNLQQVHNNCCALKSHRVKICYVFSLVIRKPKLIGYWRRTSETGSSGASIIAYNNITAFKFPDKMQVYLTCNIEVCNIQHYYHMHIDYIYYIMNDTFSNSVAQQKCKVMTQIAKILQATMTQIAKILQASMLNI
jgi:hypothetical protein